METEQLGGITLKDISERFRELGIQITKEEEDGLVGEYKNYEFIVDDKKQVIIGGKAEGPRAEVLIATAIDDESGNINIQVIAKGEIQSIESIDGATLMIENSKSDKIFQVAENGIYEFKIIETNGRITIAKTIINNIVETIEAESLLAGVSNINSSGIKKVKINEKEEEYLINAILYEGDLELDGNKEVIGSILNETTYEFGSKNDVATQTEEAKNSVLLKVNGNLTVDEGITLTSCKSSNGYGGPKGMIIYCTGTFTNNGTTSMTARGAKAQGEDIYLWKNQDNSYEYVPANGADGGGSIEIYNGAGRWSNSNGKSGINGINRTTGGGGGGACRAWATWAVSGAGSKGTSFSGGSGGGSIIMRS